MPICPRCGCETKIRGDGVEVCVNCGIVGQKLNKEVDEKSESDKTPSYIK